MLLAAALLAVLAGVCVGPLVGGEAVRCYRLVTDREWAGNFLLSFGVEALLVFIGLQVLQVVFALVPGETTGFIGGYMFGTLEGFLYSTVGLTIGSWLNFMIGRFLGRRWVRRLIPPNKLQHFDTLLKRQGVIVVFLCFVMPGFPKDFLSLFLGLSTMPVKLFLILALTGRMPGTLMLSVQGAFLFERQYAYLASVLAMSALFGLLSYRYREAIYRWLARFNRNGA